MLGHVAVVVDPLGLDERLVQAQAPVGQRRPAGPGPGPLVELALGQRHHLAGGEARALETAQHRDQAIVADAGELGDRATAGLGV